MNSYGICLLSAVPMRSEPSDKQELCSQVLFGDTYQIIAEHPSKKWLKIQLDEDGYQGWIDAQQHQSLSKEAHQALKKQEKIISTDAITALTQGQQEIRLSIGSFLPYLKQNQLKIGQGTWQYKGAHKNLGGKSTQIELRDDALKLLHTPYLWGGKTAFGIDCSGFIQQIFRLAGCTLPRDAYQQAEQGMHIPEINKAQTADLAFFEREGRIVHVGIIIQHQHSTEAFPDIKMSHNEHFIIHALEKIRIDKLDTQGILNLDRQVYTHTLHSIKRIL